MWGNFGPPGKQLENDVDFYQLEKLCAWSNYNDLTRPGPPKGSVLEGKWDPLFQGNRVVGEMQSKNQAIILPYTTSLNIFSSLLMMCCSTSTCFLDLFIRCFFLRESTMLNHHVFSHFFHHHLGGYVIHVFPITFSRSKLFAVYITGYTTQLYRD